MTKLTPESMRAGRGLLRWTLRDLAREAGVALSTVHQFEKGDRDPHDATAGKIVAAFAAHGVEILNGDAPGARMRGISAEGPEDAATPPTLSELLTDYFTRPGKTEEFSFPADMPPEQAARATIAAAQGKKQGLYGLRLTLEDDPDAAPVIAMLDRVLVE